MIKSTIDRFYERCGGHLDAVAGYLEDEHISFIIKACRLKPYDVVLGPIKTTPRLERFWFDEYRTSIKIFKDKRLKITCNDLSIDSKKITSTDIFLNVEMPDLPRISKLAYLAILTDDVDGTPIYLMSFLGRDNYFRTKILIDNCWVNISTLYLGIRLLKIIVDNLLSDYFIELDSNVVVPTIPFECNRQWITSWPPHKHLIRTVNIETPTLLELIGIQ